MSKTESHIPKLRFSGFSDPWQKDYLENRVKILDSKRIPLSEEERKDKQGVYPYYGASGIIDFIDNYIFDGEYVLLGEDGANIVTRSTRLAFIAQGKFWVNNHAHIFQAIGSNYFLAESLERINYEKYNTGTAQPKLNMAICRKISLDFPCEVEQTKIGDFFQKIDQVIELQQKALETAQNYKKSMLQKMFPQKGEKVPKVRFAGFSGDWEEFCLNDIADNFNGLSGKTKEDFGSGFPFITYKHIFANSGIKDFVDCELVTINSTENQSLVQYGDIFFTTSSETPEEVGFSSVLLIKPIVNTYLNSFCFGVRIRKLTELSPEFSQYLFRCPLSRKSIEILAQGSTRFNISKTNFMKLMFFKPKLEEQQKIGAFFKKLDQQIEQHEKKLESYQSLKKAMLQRMFV